MQSITASDTKELAEDDRDKPRPEYSQALKDRLQSKYSLARAYSAINQEMEAMELLEEVVAVATRCFDEDDQDRLTCQHALGLAYIRDGRAKDAVEILQQVVDTEEKLFQEENQLQAASQASLAFALESNGEFDKAISMMQRAASTVRKCLPPINLERIETEEDLTRMVNAYSSKTKLIKEGDHHDC